MNAKCLVSCVLRRRYTVLFQKPDSRVDLRPCKRLYAMLRHERPQEIGDPHAKVGRYGGFNISLEQTGIGGSVECTECPGLHRHWYSL